ncbi:MAG: hypothetical protein GY842_26065 [bacterium]|nr:hypothetical protein [bacterium]
MPVLDSRENEAGRITARMLLFVFLVALGARAGWGLYRMSASGSAALEFPDEQQYWLMATSLHEGRGLTDELGFRAGRMPLYPAGLSLVVGCSWGVAAVKVAQWLIGGLGAVFAAILGSRFGGRGVGVLVGLAFAVDPFLIFFSNLVLTETLFLTVLVAWWSYVARFAVEPRGPTWRQWILVGLLGLACVYARESTLGLIGAVLVVHLIRRRFERNSWLGVAVVGGVLLAGLFPWALRNHQVLGDWCWLTTRAGISLYDGVGPQATGASDLGDVKRQDAVRELTELEYNRYFLNAAWAEVRADPFRVVQLAVRKFGRMWNPVPNAAEYQSAMVRVVSAAWMIPLLLLALAGAVVLARDRTAGGLGAVVFLLLPALYLSALHMVFVGSVRYRLGAMPMLAVLAAVVLVRWWERGRTRG